MKKYQEYKEKIICSHFKLIFSISCSEKLLIGNVSYRLQKLGVKRAENLARG